jgi:hypothetical protein
LGTDVPFYTAINSIRTSGRYGTAWRKRTPKGDFNITGKLTGLLKGFLGDKGRPNGVNVLKSQFTSKKRY